MKFLDTRLGTILGVIAFGVLYGFMVYIGI